MDFVINAFLQNPFMTKMQPMQNPLQNPRFYCLKKLKSAKRIFFTKSKI
ncbi:hypothetical protein [Helicobacter sp. T3_23-1056]